MLVASQDAIIRVLSKDFTDATKGTTAQNSEYGGGTTCGASSPAVFIEWKVTLPTAGKWYVHVHVAAKSARPATVSINGVKQTAVILSQTTGGWDAANLRWLIYGPFDFPASESLFRLDFSNHMPHLRELLFTQSMQGSAEATVMAKDFVVSSANVPGSDGAYSNLIYSSGQKNPAIDWKVNLPKAGKWKLHVLMTAAEKRPGTLSINGVKQNGEILGEVTGGWYSDKLTWFTYGPFSYKQGENRLNVEFGNSHPHIQELSFTWVEADEPAVSKPNVDAAVVTVLERRIVLLEEKLARAGRCCDDISALQQRIVEGESERAAISSKLDAFEKSLKDDAKKLDAQSKLVGELETMAANCGTCDAVLSAQAKRIADLETKLAALQSEPVRTPVQPDDLKIIEGIGPKIAEILAAAGISTFRQLADADVATIKAILVKGGPRYATANPATWPRQAEFAAAGKHAELEAYQATLAAGK
jgi:predicted flap endonuclease-1-like 5' DNA nuclease